MWGYGEEGGQLHLLSPVPEIADLLSGASGEGRAGDASVHTYHVSSSFLLGSGTPPQHIWQVPCP